MDAVIGENAGKVWQLLNVKGAQTPAAIAKALNLKSADVDRAIGWLARECKLSFETDAKVGLKILLK